MAGNFQLTKRQLAQADMMAGDATHTMAYGGSRSGKTFGFLRGIAFRAMMAPGSRHAAFRFRFNHIKTSIIQDTWPTMMKLVMPSLYDPKRMDRSDWFYTFENGSEVWFAGLDDKERTEKILGMEFATLFFNECSQIPWGSRNTALTRLAQQAQVDYTHSNGNHIQSGPLRLKAFYDCNPPSRAHWTYRVFIDRISPDTRQRVMNPKDFNVIQMNPRDNEENLAPGYIDEILGNLSARDRKRFLLGQFGEIGEGVLWPEELCEQQRKMDGMPDIQRIVIGVDPSGASGDEDKRSDEIGIVVVGLGTDGCGYILEDASLKTGPEGWGAAVVSAWERHGADMIVGEVNFGGDMVGAVIRAADRDGITRFRKVRASRGKAVRAEPISTLFEQGKFWLAGAFPMLEEQMQAMTVSGYTGDRSPDRLDAMVWAATELFPVVAGKRQERPTPKVITQRPKVVRSASRRTR